MQFRTTDQIFNPSTDYFNPNWMDSDKVIFPPFEKWDYSRNMQIEDVNIWEVIYESSGGFAVYAAYDPYAEFYMVRAGWEKEKLGWGAETYYGPGAQKHLRKRAKELGIKLGDNKIWVDPQDMWLHQ